MKYNESLGKIILSVKEMARIAKRGVSSTLPKDEDELNYDAPSAIIKRMLPFDFNGNDESFDFSDGKYDFKLKYKPDCIKDNALSLLKTLPKGYEHPTKEIVESARAEGFLMGHCLAKDKGFDNIILTIIYINQKDLSFEESKEVVSKKRLETFFDKCKASLSIYSLPEVERVTKRLPSLKTVKFPYKEIRSGQSEMVRSTYRAIASACPLLAEAPTGTGKTASVLFPALRALGEEKCDKVFYFTPKTTTADAARDCLLTIARRGCMLKALILTAKDKVCLGQHACRDGLVLCEYSKGNKLADAVLDLYKQDITVVDYRKIVEVAKKHTVCPYELSLTYAEISDVVICDFNYLFDPGVYIKRFFDLGGNYAFLIDEAHNLPQRAREMYSVEISLKELSSPGVSLLLSEQSPMKIAARDYSEIISEILTPLLKEEARRNEEGVIYSAVHLSEVPYRLYDLFSSLESICREELFKSFGYRDNEKSQRTKLIKEYLLKIKKINTVLSHFDEKYEMFIFLEGEEIRFKLYCLDTGGVISERLEKGRSAILFSATLTPHDYYRSLFGLDNSSSLLRVGSPFDPSQLSVSVIDKISTRFSEREDTLGAICRTIAATVSVRRGNYMVFSPSFAYSKRLYESFVSKYPKIKVMLQTQDMTAGQRSEFIDEFKKESPNYLIGFCVMGGVYSEGIDLVGDSLIGAVVVGIGMPNLSYEREAICAYFDEKYEAGKQYAYIYPGINRVLQAAGRVIRDEGDRGVVVLIDDRFADPIYKKTAPDLWSGMKYIDNATALKAEIEGFWKRVDEESTKKQNKN